MLMLLDISIDAKVYKLLTANSDTLVRLVRWGDDFSSGRRSLCNACEMRWESTCWSRRQL